MLSANIGFFIPFLKLYKSSPWFCNTFLKWDSYKMVSDTERETETERLREHWTKRKKKKYRRRKKHLKISKNDKPMTIFTF